MRRILARLIAARYALLTAWAAAWGVALWGRRSDWLVFEIGARVLLRYNPHYAIAGGPLHLYDQFPQMQIGPPALGVTAATQWLGPGPGKIAAAVLMTAIGVFCVAVAERVARLGGVPAERARLVAFVGGLPLLACWATLATWALHLDDALVVGFLAAAVLAVARDRAMAAGLLLGLAAATKPWALIMLPLVFALPRPSRAKAGLAAFLGAVLPWLPFVLAAPESVWALAGYHIPVTPGSTVSLLVAPGGATPPIVRPAQFLLGAAACLLVVRRGRWWAAPYAALVVRVLTDPAAWPYYGVPVVAAALLWDTRSGRRLPSMTVVAAAAEFAAPWVLDGTPLALMRLVVLGSTLIVAAEGTAQASFGRLLPTLRRRGVVGDARA